MLTAVSTSMLHPRTSLRKQTRIPPFTVALLHAFPDYRENGMVKQHFPFLHIPRLRRDFYSLPLTVQSTGRLGNNFPALVTYETLAPHLPRHCGCRLYAHQTSNFLLSLYDRFRHATSSPKRRETPSPRGVDVPLLRILRPYLATISLSFSMPDHIATLVLVVRNGTRDVARVRGVLQDQGISATISATVPLLSRNSERVPRTSLRARVTTRPT